MELSDRLKELRIFKNITQVQMAKIIGVATSTYQNYERGEREAPKSFLEKVVTAFEVSSDWLLMGRGNMFELKPEDAREILGGDLHDIAGCIDSIETAFTPEERNELYAFMDSLRPELRAKLLQMVRESIDSRELRDIRRELRELRAEIDKMKQKNIAPPEDGV